METNLNRQLQVVAGNQELVPTGSTRQKIGEENQLAQALAAPQIRHGGVEELKQALRFAMVKVGLRAANWPQDEEKAILLAHVLQEYGTHTAAEIRLAFDMAISGKLDIAHKEVVCYENFSCLYFSGVMNAYRRWAAQAYRHAIVEPPPATSRFPKYDIDMGYAAYLYNRLIKRLLPPLKP